MSERDNRRAARLTLLYPRQWRRRYPDFVEALAGELADHPQGVRSDVMRGAAIERLRVAGVLPSCPVDQARSGLALVYAALLPFVGLSAGMWSQVHTAAGGLGSTVPVMRAADLLLAVGTAIALASLAVGVPLVISRARRLGGGSTGVMTSRPFVGPAIVLAGAMAVLTGCGWSADTTDWYSPAAAALPAGGPGHVLTLWARAIIAAITPAWIHPSMFERMPTGDLLATLVAPIAVVVAGAALLRLIVRLPVPAPRRVHLVTAVTAVATVGAMFLSTAATARWLLADPLQEGSAPLRARLGQLTPGHTPWAVAVALVVLAVVAAIGTRRVLQGGDMRPESGAENAAPTSNQLLEDGAPPDVGSLCPIPAGR